MAAGNIITIEEFAKGYQGGRLIGLDLGSKTIGVAVSDSSLRIATGVKTIKRQKFNVDAKALLELAEGYKAAAMIIGLPLNMEGSEGPRAQSTRAFVRNFGRLSSTPFVLWDERLSSVAAERVMLEGDLSRRKRAEKIDMAAATIILQGALDRLANLLRENRSPDPGSRNGQ